MMCYEPMELLYLTVYLVSLAIVVNIVIIPPSSLDSKIIPLDQEPTSRPSDEFYDVYDGADPD
ncbi:hypothetical protein BD311DRAFT_759064 [Dichomitus squalens]|uniref:Uncharacterized protein n=1 Tax=Dichomitus squalens TaxID=114155 RepID=A0A4Q9MNS4_9APHY|nr:hypothetical protein BD311DRAFT_759064 [Dichomitus squalens]